MCYESSWFDKLRAKTIRKARESMDEVKRASPAPQPSRPPEPAQQQVKAREKMPA